MISVEKHVDFVIEFHAGLRARVRGLQVVITLLSLLGVVTQPLPAKNRKYAILINFVIAAMLTPTPDIVKPGADGGAALPALRGWDRRGAGSSAGSARKAAGGARRPPSRGGRSVSPFEFTSLDLPEPVMAGFLAAPDSRTARRSRRRCCRCRWPDSDVAGQAQTGTGKTAAFLITLFTRLLATDRGSGVRAAAACPHHRPDARARRADRSRRAPSRRWDALLHDPCGLRRHRLRKQLEALRQRRPTSWSARPGRLIDYQKQHVYAPERPDPGHRRGGPHVRHGLHRRPPVPAEEDAAVTSAASPSSSPPPFRFRRDGTRTYEYMNLAEKFIDHSQANHGGKESSRFSTTWAATRNSAPGRPPATASTPTARWFS